ncbi:ISPsy3, transposase, partial [Pseudomonas savastanoi pv. glycinea str. race 4]
GRQLPRVYEALRMERRGKAPKLYFAQMSKAFLHGIRSAACCAE